MAKATKKAVAVKAAVISKAAQSILALGKAVKAAYTQRGARVYVRVAGSRVIKVVHAHTDTPQVVLMGSPKDFGVPANLFTRKGNGKGLRYAYTGKPATLASTVQRALRTAAKA